MKYIKVDANTFLEYNEAFQKSQVLVKSEIEEQIADYEGTIAQSDIITDEQLLAWAKINYPESREYKEQQVNISELERLRELLTHLK